MGEVQKRSSRIRVCKFTQDRKSWTPEEGEQLKELVVVFGTSRWVKVGEEMAKHRTEKQCRERWIDHIDPNVRKGPWSEVREGRGRGASGDERSDDRQSEKLNNNAAMSKDVVSEAREKNVRYSTSCRFAPAFARRSAPYSAAPHLSWRTNSFVRLPQNSVTGGRRSQGCCREGRTTLSRTGGTTQ